MSPEPAPMQNERIVVLGKVRTAVGLAGWVKIQSHTQPPENILNFRTWQVCRAGAWMPMDVAERRAAGAEVQVRMEGCANRDAAELLRGLEVGVFRHELPAPEPGQYYLDDLLGFEVLASSGGRLGRLDHFLDTPAHPLMVIAGEAQTLVPMVKERVLGIDFDRRSITVDWELGW